MKKTLLTLGITASLALSLSAQAADYTVDTKGAHASINFKTSHLGYSIPTGRFNTFDGTFSYDPDNIEASTVIINIDPNSVDSNHAERDKHIRTADSLDTSKFKESKFESTKVTQKDDGTFDILGNLTLHGQTKPITINAVFVGEGNDPWGGERAGFNGTTRIEFADFGIPELGATNYVDLDLYIEGIKNK